LGSKDLAFRSSSESTAKLVSLVRGLREESNLSVPRALLESRGLGTGLRSGGYIGVAMVVSWVVEFGAALGLQLVTLLLVLRPSASVE